MTSIENNEVVSISLEVDTKQYEESVNSIIESFSHIRQEISNQTKEITKSFDAIAQKIQSVSANFNEMTMALATCSGCITELVCLITSIGGMEEGTSVFDIFGSETESFSTTLSTVTNITSIIGILIEQGPVVAKVFTTAFNDIGTIIGISGTAVGIIAAVLAACIALIVIFWDDISADGEDKWTKFRESLTEITGWIDQHIIHPISEIVTPVIDKFSEFGQALWQLLVDIGDNFRKFVQESQNILSAIWTTVFYGVINKIKESVAEMWNEFMTKYAGVFRWIKEHILDPVGDRFKNMVNGVIGFINGMIAGIIRGINGVIEALNKLKFTVPDWVPGLGGQTLGFHLKTLTAPQIPYLAKGAVLPANKPFMAVVGDQRHGTNIEAPLTTIQEAVAGVMENHIAAMMAGFNALLQEQIALRHTVESIELGDNTIAAAVDRYHEKMSIVYGYGAG